MRYIACLLLLTLFACNDSEPEHESSESAGDTSIVSYNTIEHGSFDSSSCVNYTISAGQRNTGFTCSACRHIGSLRHGALDIMLLGEYGKPITYRAELRYLQLLLPYIAKRFSMDSLVVITLGSITDHPDLAVKLTNEYQRQFGKLEWSAGPKDIHTFLDTSVIAKDFNRLLAPYSVKVLNVAIEKLSMAAGKRNLLARDAMESDTANIPEKVIDGMLWVYVRKN